jgi:hypothetical protein
MRTFPLQNEEGKLHAFEVRNMLLSRRGVVKVVSRIPGVSIIRKPKFFSWRREDVFCKFMVDGKLFVVEEPYGDNSRFLVGGEPPGWCPELEIVERVFSEA